MIRPRLSYGLNADFEDHAEHEYMILVAENPQWDTEPYDVAFSADYGLFQSMADVLRQIGHDERVHKQGSLEAIKQPRFQLAPPRLPNRGSANHRSAAALGR